MRLHEGPVDLWFTIGPKSRNPLAVRQLIESGATGVRLGFSFGGHDLQTQRAEMVQTAAEVAGESFVTVADLPGEKIRLGDFGGRQGYDVETDETVTLVSQGPEVSAGRLPVDPELVPRVADGDTLVIGDGAVRLAVEDATDDRLVCRVRRGGRIDPNRGVVVRGSDFEPQSLTPSDREALRYIGQSGQFDGVALSFVSRADDVEAAREVLSSAGETVPVIAKIETGDGVENAREICAAADAVMVARGDLAQFCPWTELPAAVDEVVTAATETDTPWVMATQIAEGLERFSFPTRAEICDLAQWVDRGADGVLLSYETAFGDSPTEAVRCTRELLDETAEWS